MLTLFASGLTAAQEALHDSEANDQLIDGWEFVYGDDAEWPGGDFGEADWMPVRPSGGLRSQPTLRSERQLLGWYRARFATPSGFVATQSSSFGVFLGRIEDMDQTFVNGESIGGEGMFHRWPVPRKLRWYAIPDRLLAPPGEENELAIRVQLWSNAGGLTDREPILAPALAVEKLGAQRELRAIFVDTALLALHGTGVLLWLALVLGRRWRTREHMSLGLTLVSFLCLEALSGSLVYVFVRPTSLGSATGTVVGYVVLVLIASSQVAALLGSLKYFYDLMGARTHPFLSLAACTAVLSSLVVLPPGAAAPWQVDASVFLVVATMTIGVIGLLPAVRRAWAARKPGIGTMLFAALALSLGTLVSLLPSVPPRTAAAIFSTVLVLFPLLLVVSFAQRHRAIDRHASRLGSQLISATETERDRVARDLHDGVVQRLAAHALSLRHAVRRSDLSLVERVVEQVGRTADEVRAIINDLRPVLLDRLGLAQALEAHVEQVAERSEARVEIAFEIEDDLRLPRDVEEQLFRMTQEALSNALRHSEAGQVLIRLTSPRSGELKLTVADDGRGFDPSTAHDGLGLATMNERARAVGARLDIRSSAGSGTTVSIHGVRMTS